MGLPLHAMAAPSNPPVMFPVQGGRWLQVVSHLDPKYGGLSSAVPELSASLAQSGRLGIDLVAFCAPGEDYRPAGPTRANISYWPTSRGTWLHNQKLRYRLSEKVRLAAGLHLHGLWEQSTAVSGKMARAARKPYVLSAHGMLEPWALSKKRVKKIVYSALIERANVNGAACLHALTQAEAKDYRRYGSHNPIAVIPNGVHIPSLKNATPFFEAFPHLLGKRIVLFLGRLHQKKGVDLLIKAWATIAPRWPESHLILAGPDSEDMQSSLEQLITELKLESHVSFTGMLRGDMKWNALAAAACFILPSHSEGLSVSVLEAMGMGLPVIVTEQCNMPEVSEKEAGWQIQPKIDEIAAAIDQFLRNSTQANIEIGCRGRYLVQERYTWASVAERMAEVYRWIQGGPLPHSVDLIFN